MKQQLYFTLYASNEVSTLKIEFDNKSYNNTLIFFLKDFLEAFDSRFVLSPEEITVEFNCYQQNDKKLNDKVYQVISNYKNFIPVINKVGTFLKKLSLDEHFFLLPYNDESIPAENHAKLQNELLSLNNPNLQYDEINEEFNNMFGHIIEKYHGISLRADRKVRIGEGLISNRTCRFCYKTSQETSFKSVAHAIPEALGNKNFILNEECDKCNKYFSATLEKDILIYLRIFNTFYQVKNKANKVSKIKQSEFQVMHINADDPKNGLILEEAQRISEHPFNPRNFFVIKVAPGSISSKAYTTTDGIPNLALTSDEDLILQNIYKALVKFALSVIKSDYLVNFDKTINWLRDDNSFETSLPKVSILLRPEKLEQHPYMIVHIRKDEDEDLPYAVGEFHYTTFTYVFIIPTFRHNEKDFSKENNFNNFKDFFSHYQFDDFPWSHQNFNSSISRKFSLNFNFKQIEK